MRLELPSMSGRAVARTLAALIALAPFAGGTHEGAGAPTVLRSAVDDEPLDMAALLGSDVPPAVSEFVKTGRNPYIGNAQAAADGKQRFEQWCQICHLADASGRMGPSLVDDVYNYKRSHTDLGMFEIIYGGAAGAMQAFNERMTPDEILKVIAYVRSLRPK